MQSFQICLKRGKGTAFRLFWWRRLSEQWKNIAFRTRKCSTCCCVDNCCWYLGACFRGIIVSVIREIVNLILFFSFGDKYDGCWTCICQWHVRLNVDPIILRMRALQTLGCAEIKYRFFSFALVYRRDGECTVLWVVAVSDGDCLRRRRSFQLLLRLVVIVIYLKKKW